MSIAYDFPQPVDSSADRIPPQDIPAEQSVLGAMLMSKDAISMALGIIKGRDFYKPAHELIFDTIVSLYAKGDPADAITVAAELVKQGDIGRVGGHVYIHDLLSMVSIASNVSYYAEIVREKAILRRLVDASIRIAQLGYAGQGEADVIVDQAQQAIYDVAEGNAGEDYKSVGELIQGTWEELDLLSSRDGMLSGVPTGFAGLDGLLNGLHPGQMIIVAARPGIGKSTLGLDFARNAAIHHKMTTAIFSLEMSASEIMMRLLSAEASVPLKAIHTGNLEDYWDRLNAASAPLAYAPLYIDDSPNLTMMEIRAKARRLRQRNDLKLVVIDYIQLMSSGKKVESRQLEVSEFSRQIKLMAKELDIPVVAISQLNRESEQGPQGSAPKEPKLSNLRESGSLEQDADVVILLHRPGAYAPKDDKKDPETQRRERIAAQSEAKFIIAKHRNGPTGEIPVIFMGHLSRFSDDPSATYSTES